MSRISDRLRAVRWKRLLLVGGGGGLGLALTLGGVGYAMTEVPAAKDTATNQTTIITYSDGSEMARVGKENRRLIRLDDVPKDVQEAVLAAEDRGFYTEPGISPRGIARALFTNVRGGGVQAGGSSITQQYAKNAYLTTERTYTRKVKEVFIALKMTRTRTKDQILEDYLNTIYFGRRAEGIEVAAQTYFNKPASGLNFSEGAVLAASIRSPAGYDPAKHPERARERWNYVLDGMVEKGWLSPSTRAAAVYPVAATKIIEKEAGASSNGHIVNAVIEELSEILSEDELRKGGYTVQTTIRREAQEAAIKAVQDVVTDKKSEDGQLLQGALVSVKPGTGEVWAYYGGANGAGYDFAGQGVGRQPGSSFKPYVLAAALEQEIGLRSRFDGDSPQEFDGFPNPVENFRDRSYGRVNLVEATERSINTAYVALGLEVGPGKVAELAHRAGIPEDVRLAEANGQTLGGIALGTYEVHVIDQAVGFATFANRGARVEPFLVYQIRDSDKEPYYTARTPEPVRAFSAEVAADATYAMQQVVRSGTGEGARLDEQPAAGKTGTSQDNRDAWFVGFTPQLSTAVWLGYPKPEPIRLDGVAVTGGGFSTGIWKDYMEVALAGPLAAQGVIDFPERADIGRRAEPAPQQEEPRQEQEPDPEPEATVTEPAPEQSTAAPTTPTPEPTGDQGAVPGPTGAATRQPVQTPQPAPVATAPPTRAVPAQPTANARAATVSPS